MANTKATPPLQSAPAQPAPAHSAQAHSDITLRSRKRMRFLLLICGVGALTLKLSFVFFAIGMMPAMVAYIVDHDKNKYLSSTVAAFNFAGVFPDMMSLFMRGGTFDAVRDKLSDAVVWFTMYSAAGLGWALVWLSPLIAAMVLEGIYKGRILHLEGIQKKLEEEWGPEITGKVTEKAE